MICTSSGAALRALALSAALTATGATLAGCGGSSSSADLDGEGPSLSVAAGDKTCTLSTSSLQAGRHTVSVRNAGTDTTEVYVYAAGDKVVGEVENIGPAITRKLVVDLKVGTYDVACKPGMTGKGIRSALEVTAAGTTSTGAGTAVDPATQKVVADYRAYVTSEASALATTTTSFVAAVKAGNVALAKQRYGACRLHWERIEPIAESFADLDPRIDMREDDATDGTPFIGFHKLERDLFVTGDISASGPTATALLADTTKVVAQIPQVEITTLTMANGAKALLDEVAKSKVTGEEERYSHIDLVDFAGNVEGAKAATDRLRPLVAARNATLMSTLDTRFAALLALLDAHKVPTDSKTAVPGSAYASYASLTKDEVKRLAVAVDALSEPLGALPAELS